MLENLKFDKVVFIDIETVSQKSSYNGLSEEWKGLWEKKSAYLSKEEESPEELYEKGLGSRVQR